LENRKKTANSIRRRIEGLKKKDKDNVFLFKENQHDNHDHERSRLNNEKKTVGMTGSVWDSVNS